MLFMKRNSVSLEQGKKIVWRVARQRRARKMRIRRQKISRPHIDIGEIAAPAAGDADFFADPPGVINQDDA